MTFISYAQNFEDIMLWRALGHLEKGFYIDAGAYLPSEDSVTRAFYDRGWHGINIEPNPNSLIQLKSARSHDINLGVAVGKLEGTVELFIIADTGLTTIIPSIAKEHESKGFSRQQIEAPLRTLSSIWNEYVPRSQEVHFLKIDVEGNEADALRGMDWAKDRPWIVVVESTYPRSQIKDHADWEHILLDADYTMAYWDGLNRFYVAREHDELLPAFSTPPNVFDEFELARFRDVTITQHDKIVHMTQELQALRDKNFDETAKIFAETSDLKGGQDSIARDLAQLSNDLQLSQTKNLDEAARIFAFTNDLKGGQENIARDLGQLLQLVQNLQATQDAFVRETELRCAAENMKKAQRPRAILSQLFFRHTGRPRYLVWRLFFHKSGRPRGVFKDFVFYKDGRPHGEFREWVQSAEYSALSGAVRPIEGGNGTVAPKSNRHVLARLFFRRSGRPRYLVWRFFFHKNGRPRGVFKHLVFHKDGRPHGEFREWVQSAEYLGLSGAVRQHVYLPVAKGHTTIRAEYFLARLKSKQLKDTSE